MNRNRGRHWNPSDVLLVGQSRFCLESKRQPRLIGDCIVLETADICVPSPVRERLINIGTSSKEKGARLVARRESIGSGWRQSNSILPIRRSLWNASLRDRVRARPEQTRHKQQLFHLFFFPVFVDSPCCVKGEMGREPTTQPGQLLLFKLVWVDVIRHVTNSVCFLRK